MFKNKSLILSLTGYIIKFHFFLINFCFFNKKILYYYYPEFSRVVTLIDRIRELWPEKPVKQVKNKTDLYCEPKNTVKTLKISFGVKNSEARCHTQSYFTVCTPVS